jgi:hypothetical protein
MGTCQLREKTLTEKHRSSRIAGGWHKVDNPKQKVTCREIRKKKVLGPLIAVEPMMMMMMMMMMGRCITEWWGCISP